MPVRSAFVLLVFAVGPASAAPVDFGRDVLPILSDNCFHCHGPDEGTRKAGLRLDTQEGAFRKKKDRVMLVPGKSAESEVYRRLVSDDDGEVMPPPDSNRKLTKPQIEILKRWIDEGAKWGQHWAYTPLPREVSVPQGDATNPIDRFIRVRLAKEKLPPAPAATKAAWLRRVTFDLTGLPPTPTEIDAFEKDSSPTAFEKQVDRLLASPRYGERMAADWLDVARFADTHGYQADRFRPMWAYRDWVIRAFNANQPYDRFAADQLAGDLVPNATKDQRLATAFNRLHCQNEEGGIVEEEFRVAYVVDRVTTFGTAFLGQTLECCRCHDHKYDPFRMRDFYGLFAFFQNIDESGQTVYFTGSMPVPTLLLSTDEQDKKRAQLRAAVVSAERDLDEAHERAEAAFDLKRFLDQGRRPADFVPPGDQVRYTFDGWKGGELLNDGFTIRSKHAGKPHDGPTPAEGQSGGGVRLSGENGFTFPGVGHFSRSDPFTLAAWLNPAERVPRAVVLHHSKAPIDAGSRGYELLLEGGRVAFGLHHMWPGNSIKVVSRELVPVDMWTHVAVTYDGSSRAAGVRVYIDGKPVSTDVVRDGLYKDITYEGGEPDLALGYRFRDNGFRGGSVDDLRVFPRALTKFEVNNIAGRTGWKKAWTAAADKTTAEQRADLTELFFAEYHKPTMEARDRLRDARRAEAAFVNAIPEAMVMHEMPAPKPAFMLKRGQYDTPGDAVSADVPASLPPFAADLPRNRLGLAKWLTHPDHPLFARVAVNRLWQQMFGSGLVETSDNFGTTGTPPTHPELLDWLARDFARDWDVKRVLKQMALSTTYRQESKASAELRSKDPYNHLLARAPVRRLSAEMLRDQALAMSGLLVEKPGGPSVYPYQPDGLWNEAMGRPQYTRSKGDDLYRRSLYTVYKRTAPPPLPATFDAADRSVCSVRRQSTSTPLQALALMNDTQFVEAARFLGQRMMKDGGKTPAERVTWAFRTVIGRSPTEKESALLVGLLVKQRERYAKDTVAADKLLSVGDGKADARVDKAELAAATSVAQALLNHDEAVNRR